MANKTEVRTVSYNTGNEAILGFQVLSDPLLGHYCLQLRPQQCIVAPSLQARHAPELLAITNEIAAPRGESGSAFQEAFGRFQATYQDYKVQSHMTAPIQLSSPESCAQFVEHRKRVYNTALKDILELEAVMGAHVEELGVEVTNQQHSFDEVEREITQLLANQARIQEKIKLQREASTALLQGLSAYRPDHGDLTLSDAEQEFHAFLGQLTDLAGGVASVEGGEGGRLALTGEVGSRLVDLRNAVEYKRRYKLKYKSDLNFLSSPADHVHSRHIEESPVKAVRGGTPQKPQVALNNCYSHLPLSHVHLITLIYVPHLHRPHSSGVIL
jgi:hypothetical protein